MDRHGAVRRAQAPRPEPRRRHVLPLRLAGDPRRGRGRRRHHLQAALQRHGRDDRRPGRRRRRRRPRRSREMLLAEGVSEVIVTTDDLDRYDDDQFPEGVEVWDRTRLDEAQKVLAAIPGTTVLIHDQRCAAENAARPQPRQARHARASGSSSTSGSARAVATAATRATACRCNRSTRRSDARRASTRPAATSTSRACEGDCPAFATVLHERRPPRSAPARRRAEVRPSATSPSRRRSSTRPIHRAPLGHRRHRRRHRQPDPRHGRDARRLHACAASTRPACRRRPGPVTERHPHHRGAVLVVEPRQRAGRRRRAGVRPAGRRQRLAPRAAPTPDRTVVDRQHRTPSRPARWSRIPTHRVSRRSSRCASGSTRCHGASSTATSTPPTSANGLFGGTTTVNIFMLGVAVQVGAVPVAAEFHRAGDRAQRRRRRTRTSRRSAGAAGWAVDPDAVEKAAGLVDPPPETLDEMIARLAADLADYQTRDTPIASAPRSIDVRAAEQTVDPSSTALTDAVARNLHKLMAYKDEYEVARLLLLDRVARSATRRSVASARRSPTACTRRCCGRWG